MTSGGAERGAGKRSNNFFKLCVGGNSTWLFKRTAFNAFSAACWQLRQRATKPTSAKFPCRAKAKSLLANSIQILGSLKSRSSGGINFAAFFEGPFINQGTIVFVFFQDAGGGHDQIKVSLDSANTGIELFRDFATIGSIRHDNEKIYVTVGPHIAPSR